VDSTLLKAIYETGMKVVYDQSSKRVVVSFRGRITVLPESFDNESDAVKAGEHYCRQNGWNPTIPKATTVSLRRAWD
jgi:hypothetical protein